MLWASEKIAVLAFHWQTQSAIRAWPDVAVPAKQPSLALCENDGVLFIADTPSVAALDQLRQTINAPTDIATTELRQPEFCLVPTITMEPTIVFQDPEQSRLSSTEPSEHKNNLATTEHYFQCMSAGSNGKPKRVRRTHKSWLTSFDENATRANITSDDSYAIVGKLSHSLALYAALEAANIGADIHALGDLRPDHQTQALQQLASTIMYATPTQLRLIAKQAKRLNITDFKLRHIFSGGGKLDKRTAELLSLVFPNASVQEFYGATETSFITLSDKHTPMGSVGKVYPGVQVRIHNTQQHEGRTIGEIHVKSPYLFHGYVGTPEHAAEWQDGFINLNELGYLDDDAYLFLAGRESRRVNIADQLVFPEEIESVLNEHPAVHASAVIAITDPERGHVLAAVIEAQDESGPEQSRPEQSQLVQSLLHDLRKQVGSLKAPRKIICVDQLPLLASGKPDLVAAAALLNCS